MSDPDAVPVDEQEPIDHVENDVIVAGVVNSTGIAPTPRGHSPFESPVVLWAAVVALACFTLIAATSTIAQYRSADRDAAIAADVNDQRETEACWARLDVAADVVRVAYMVGAARQHDAAWQAVLAYSRGDAATAQAKTAEAEALTAQLSTLEAEVRAALDAYQAGIGPCATPTTTTTSTTAPP